MSLSLALQRSRGVIAAERVILAKGGRTAGVASTEPRRDRRGETFTLHGIKLGYQLQRSRGVIAAESAPKRRSTDCPCRFNGAAA